MIMVLLLLGTSSIYASIDKPTKCAAELTEILSQISDNQPRYSCTENTATIHLGKSKKQHSLEFVTDDLPIAPAEPFYGLAAYYNTIGFFHTTPLGVKTVYPDVSIMLGEVDWLVASGRFKVLLIKAPDATATITDETLTLTWQENSPANLTLSIAPKTNLTDLNPEWGDLRYQRIWSWIAIISKGVEWSLVNIQKHIVINWGWAIVIFAILLKILLLPISYMTVRLQNNTCKYQAILTPQLAEIKAKYDGEEAHNRIMAAHKTLGITPFYTLKPMAGVLVQLPILVAIFNALGEMPQLSGAEFLWIRDLSYPDAIASLPFIIPFFGDTLNLLPILMTVVTVLSTIVFQNPHALPSLIKRQRRNLYFMALAFLILFYPFPAAMVLYWALANVLQALQQQLVS